MMTRETKIGLLVGLAFIIVIGILLSDHLSSANDPPQAALGIAGDSVREGVTTPGGAGYGAGYVHDALPRAAATHDAPSRTVNTRTDLVAQARRPSVGIVQVGPEGAIKPELQTLIGVTTDFKPYRPDQMQQIRKNEFQVGTQTVVDLERDYSRILSRDLSYSTYKNPRTGANEGIKINRVAPNSIPAQAGLSEGEVLKSINGHKVTSVNDAVAFVKANVNTTDTWVAVFEKQGREFTRTYHSPEQ